jgi:SpoVK/Ycf46/Vps4 family AAA+-type ATPase
MGMGGSLKDKASQRDMLRADAAPVAVDPKLGFQSVGGLEKHVQALKEMVVLPLLYPDVFQRFDTQPPRGVLFVGPPGTGKTLTARALANSVTMSAAEGGRKVSFFMRKGADCLSKWVGEGERQLRLLFEQAKRYQPSIIFFDEIDGLAPVRSVKQDQIHASIVSTLLALMDGLDARGQVVVIGATNRPDAIDPALRRPGRFDRELTFPLPDARARAAIIEINTGSWQPSLSNDLKQWLVQSTAGYCGADLKALCAEAALVALRRAYPQVYDSTTRLELDPSRLILGKGDFAAALNKVIPASRRGVAGSPARPLGSIVTPLLAESLERIMKKINSVLPSTNSDKMFNNNDVNPSSSSSFSSSSSQVSSSGDGLLPLQTEDEEIRLQTHNDRLKNERNSFENISPNCETWIAALTDMQDDTALMECISENDTSCPSSYNDKYSEHDSTLWDSNSVTSRPRVLIAGERGMGQGEVVAAALQRLEGMTCFSVDHPSLLADLNAHSPEQALVNRVQEACKAYPSVVYLPSITSWWSIANESMRCALIALIEAIPANLPVLWMSTLTLEDCETPFTHEDNRLISVIAWLSNTKDNMISSKSRKNEYLGMMHEIVIKEGPGI